MSDKAKKDYLNACISRAARSIQDGDANAVWVYVTVGGAFMVSMRCYPYYMPNEKLYLTLRSRPMTPPTPAALLRKRPRKPRQAKKHDQLNISIDSHILTRVRDILSFGEKEIPYGAMSALVTGLLITWLDQQEEGRKYF